MTDDAAKIKPGRPSAFSDAKAQEICDRLSKGEPLASICADENMPAVRTVSDWKAAHATFSADFAHARDAGFDAIALDCLYIADDTSNDTKLIKGENGAEREVCDSEWISRSKLRVDTRLKLLAKWDPKRYGEKQEIDLNHGAQDSLKDLMTRIDGSSRGLPGRPMGGPALASKQSLPDQG